MSKVRVAIIGAGNCASSLVQGVEFYKDAREDEFIPGIMHANIGGYHIGDIEFIAAFDVNKNKVGKDLSEAIFTKPNNTIKFSDVSEMGVEVQKGELFDGIGKYLSEVIDVSLEKPVNIAEVLEESRADVVINYLPVGSEKAARFYAEEAMKAGCAFVNCIPVFIAKNEKWRKKFEDANVPIIGDDIKSQVGATITHRVLTRLFRDRGVKLRRTSQLNVGGNTDFYNMLERERLESKKISKTTAVTSMLDYNMGDDNVHIGPSDYVAWLTDRKWAYIRLEGEGFGGVPLNIEFKLEVWDSPNSAGVVIDAVRCARLAMDRGVSGALAAPSAYFMKSPPWQYNDDIARQMVEDFIGGN
ncbi:MAG TPA: inositol-3-phosphate synthase [Euryarchaeota archaeon]|nr:inositol-3-phosphate synthase [archaeon BMS3Bbin15]HDL15958.1 inositol-3-phosphate synthase [Euryarchaeota archaeon]